MMLGRKQSLKGEPILADYGPDEVFNESTDTEWVNKVFNTTNLLNKDLIRLILAMDTSNNEIMCPFKFNFSQLQHPQNVRKDTFYANDDVCCRRNCYISFYIGNDSENAHKRNSKGWFSLFFREIAYEYVVFQGDKPYLKDHWCQFDASMVFFLWISVILQIFEMLGIVPRFSYLSILRAPRPLIMIRFLRVFLKFSMPKSRINQIFK